MILAMMLRIQMHTIQYLDDHVANKYDEGDGKGDDEPLVDHLSVHLCLHYKRKDKSK